MPVVLEQRDLDRTEESHLFFAPGGTGVSCLVGIGAAGRLDLSWGLPADAARSVGHDRPAHVR